MSQLEVRRGERSTWLSFLSSGCRFSRGGRFSRGSRLSSMCEQPRRRCESSTCRRSRRSSARARRLRAPSSPAPAPPRRRAPHRRTRLRLIRPAQLCNVSIDVRRAAVYFVLVRREDLHRIVRLMHPRRVARVVLRPVQRGLVLDARAPRRDSLAHRPPLSIHRRSLRCSSKTKHDLISPIARTCT